MLVSGNAYVVVNIGGDGLKILGVWLWVKWKTEIHGSATVDVG